MINKTVIISCAGVGSRLGLDLPKCLVKINDKSILEIQLEQLQDVQDIRVVVGYKKDLVIDEVFRINKKVKIYENKDFLTTGTAGSFSVALQDEIDTKYVIALDGDLIVNPIDMENLLNSDEELICGEVVNTENPVLVSIDESGNVIEFSREKGEYEWAGLAQIKKENIVKGENHIYQLLEPILPMKFNLIRAKEIDTPSDLEDAKEWMNKNNFLEKEIMDNWFKSRFNIENNYEVSRHSLNDRIDYDLEFIKKYVNSNSKVLDLGSGTGILEEKIEDYVKYIKAVDKYQEFLDRTKKSDKIEFQKHDVSTYLDDKIYDLILLFGVSIYLFDQELINLINNCKKMMDENSVFIIKNQWSTSDENYIVNKQYSDNNNNMYYGNYRAIIKMIELFQKENISYEIIDIYPKQMNNYENTHEYAFVCKKNK